MLPVGVKIDPVLGKVLGILTNAEYNPLQGSISLIFAMYSTEMCELVSPPNCDRVMAEIIITPPMISIY